MNNLDRQYELCSNADRQYRELNLAFLSLLLCKENPLTRDGLAALIKHDPARYERFAGFLESRALWTKEG